MASIADGDISKNEEHHWQTDVFNNMEIDEVHREKKIMCPAILVYSEINNDLNYKMSLLRN
jgi:hypothetical protein